MELYGSLTNRIMESGRQPQPEVGMGVTECLWSDTHAYFICDVKDDRHITVQRAKVKCIDYFAGDWEVEPDPNGMKINLFKSKKGWRERIGTRELGSTKFALGFAREYEDPCF